MLAPCTHALSHESCKTVTSQHAECYTASIVRRVNPKLFSWVMRISRIQQVDSSTKPLRHCSTLSVHPEDLSRKRALPGPTVNRTLQYQ